MQRRILYIVNPISGTKDKQPLVDLIQTKSATVGIPYSIYPSVEDGDYSYLDEIIPEQGFTDIVIAGGDGTVNGAIAGLKKHSLPFGIIPSGSGNGLAFGAGISKDPAKALGVIFKGKSAWTDAFLVNGQFACLLCGLGFDAQVAHNFALDKGRGLYTYIKKIFQGLFEAKSYPFVLKLKDGTIKIDAYFISVANSNQFGNHFTIAPKASLTDGMLDVVVMACQSRWNILLQTILQVSGYYQLQQVERLNDQTSVVYFQTSELAILNKGGAPMHLDGEPIESAGKVDIRILPKCFQLIYP
ncbi:diacylglycerol kinase family protein [Chitinophagaceae bacterium LB-8]|uniref:Diacylglycerol kinase family protein n=1 Tax=Paraflavisolibacter caeni TaxID=2982496 RepID=A0A9X3B9C2_9BACT|nr:diacylglycerol kinase family protein [Paraflavisolibacter caeni]MCU7551016.1 diacylglycerol kinase family protein [Paraflavisolibacter caeni]